MLEFTDIYQLLLLLMVGIITGIELYLLIINLKRKPIEQTTNMQHVTSFKPPAFIPPPTLGTIPSVTTPYTTKVNTNVN